MKFCFAFLPFFVKVSKSPKQILKFLFEPKKERKYFCISNLSSLKRSNQKSSVRESKYNHPVSGIKCPYFYDLTSFFEARAEIQKYFCSVFGSNENFENLLSRFTDL